MGLYGGGGGGSRRSGGIYSGTSGAATSSRVDPNKKGGTSNFQWIMDRLSTPQYASAALADLLVRNAQGKPGKGGSGIGDAVAGVGRVLTGRDRWSYSDVLADAGVKNKWVKGIGGLVGDIGLDPTTYIGVGLAKAPGAAAKATKVAEGASKASKASKAAHVVKTAQESEQAIKLAKDVGKVAKGTTIAREVVKGGEVLKAAHPVREAGIVDHLLGLGSKSAPDAAKATKGAETGAKVSKLKAGAAELRAAGETEYLAAAKADEVARLGNVVRHGPAPPVGALSDVSKAATDALPKTVKKGSVLGSVLANGLPATVKKAAKGAEVMPQAGDTAAKLLSRAAKLGAHEAPVKSAVELKVLGKPILKSEKAYELGAKVLGPASQTAPAQLLSKTFRTAHGMLPEVHSVQRKYAGRGAQSVHDEIIQTQKVFQGVHGAYPAVSKADDLQIYKHIQEGSVHLLPKELQVPAQHIQKGLDKIQGVAPGMGRFEDFAKFKGGPAYNRSSQAYIAQYDAAIRKKSYQRFETEIARRFPDNPEVTANLKRTREIFGVDGEVPSQWKHYINEMTNHWKKGVTIYRPGFHIRNMLGDGFNAFLAGTDFRRFKDAALVLKHGKGTSETAKTIELGGKRFGRKVSPQEMERFYRLGGLETSFSSADFSTKVSGRLSTTLTNASDAREKYTRMTTFIDSLDRGLKKGQSMDKAIEDAAFRVRKYHFDYTDLTPAERKLKQFIPFYTYTRKELPVLLEHTLTSPGKMTAIPKAGSALETLMGVQHDPSNPFPGINGVVPDYMRGQILQRGNNKVFQPGLPTDQLGSIGPRSFAKSQVEGLSPLLKGPLEMSTKKAFPSGFDLKRKGQSDADMYTRYMLSQLPFGNLARKSKSPISERLMNMLTGAGSGTVR